jgi:UDP-GlcNAc:undecaprenyl-phosphate GlcNAc-1-phosphate transferase
LGVADDATDLTPAVRLVVEIGIGIAAAWVVAPHDAGHVVLGIVLVVVLANAVNMLDGLDGLATAVVAAGAAGFFVVLSGAGATLALALVGALLGFLVWNAPPARVYLGDAGTYLLGTALAMLFLAASGYEAAVVSSAFLFVGVPVADAAVAIVRRARARTALLRGDRGHVYDQLVDRGWSARGAAAVCAGVQIVLTAIGIGVSNLGAGAAIAVVAGVVIVVGAAAILTFTAPGAWAPDA